MAWRNPPTTRGWSSAMSTRKAAPSLIVSSSAVPDFGPARPLPIQPALSRHAPDSRSRSWSAFPHAGQATDLAQRLRHRDRRRDPDIEGTQRGLNGNAQPNVGRRPHGVWNARGFTPHKNDVPFAKDKIPQTRFALRRQQREAPLT